MSPSPSGLSACTRDWPSTRDGNETGLPEHLQVLRDRRRAHVEFINQFARGPLAHREEAPQFAGAWGRYGEKALHGRYN